MTATNTGRPVPTGAAHPQQTTKENPVTTTVISLKGRKHDYGPRLEHAPTDLVYIGRPQTMGGWLLGAHPLHNPHDVLQPKKPKPCRGCGDRHTREQAVAAYIRHLLDRPDLLAQARALRGKVLACWCAPDLCHANAVAWYADGLSRELLAERAADLETEAGLVEATLLERLGGG